MKQVDFVTAARSYVKHGGSKRYLRKVAEHLRHYYVDEITPFDIKQMATKLYPTQSNATRNRQAITPVRAVLTHAYERGWRKDYLRVKRFKVDRPVPKKPANAVWLHAFCKQCKADKLDYLACLVLFMAQTGARISEAVALRWSEIDLQARTATLLKTKTSRNSVRHLTDELCYKITELRTNKTRPSDHVFKYTSRHSVNERIAAVCKRVDIPYKSPHVCGRHTFATTAIDAGIDIATTMAAGDWKSSSVFLETYVHPRTNAGKLVANRLSLILIDDV